MESLNVNVDNQYYNAFNSEKIDTHTSEQSYDFSSSKISAEESKIHNSAVNVSISMQSLKVFMNIKSVEISQSNASAQHSLTNIINNTEVYDFLSGKEISGGFSLSSIGYDGKPITELSTQEAKDLVSDEGFFGITNTSNRVSSFVIGLADNNVEGLQEARAGIVQGFEQAEKMWGGELPELSYETQKKTLEIVDAKIAELLKTDTQKDTESLEG